MELSGTYRFAAPPATVWNLLNDPDTLASCLPGCERLEPLGEDRFRAELTVSVAAIKGHYTATVALREKTPPHSFRLIVEGSGKAGFMKGEAVVQLVEAADATIVNVNGTGEVGGLIARVGQRLLGSVSKMMMDRFFAALQEKVAKPVSPGT
jgi:carbon monoxide dehydrogenase subunit G